MIAFKRDTEREAYRVLHTEGLDGFQDRYPGLWTNLIDAWADRKLLRVKWDADSRLKITTFKKYAA